MTIKLFSHDASSYTTADEPAPSSTCPHPKISRASNDNANKTQRPSRFFFLTWRATLPQRAQTSIAAARTSRSGASGKFGILGRPSCNGNKYL